MHQLTAYQNEIARAVIDSVLNGRGLTFTVEVPRGGGVREMSAQIERALLTLHVNDGSTLLRIAPSGSPTTRDRLVEAFEGSGLRGLWSSDRGTVRFGRATLRYLDAFELGPRLADKSSVGLVEVADAQFVEGDALDRWVRPLAESSWATTVLYGHPLNGQTAFELLKERNREAQRHDGVQRHFRVCADEVARALPGFAERMAEARGLLGEEHPEYRGAYLLRPTIAGTRLLSEDRLREMEDGTRTRSPEDGVRVVASVVITRLPDGGAPGLLRSAGATAVVTIGRRHAGGLRVVEHRWVEAADEALLARRTAKVLGEWRPERIVAEDRTRVGRALRPALEHALRPAPVAWVRSGDAMDGRRLGDLLAAVHSGRLTVYRADGSPEYRTMRRELAAAVADYDGGALAARVPSGDEGFLRGLVLIVRTGAADRSAGLVETALAS
jgi:hypothetical protein